jgi:putative transposase
MGFSIPFESQHVEFWGCHPMERDEDVLEYYDQPTRIQFHYHACSGRKTSPWHTPDFLVLQQHGAVFEEWKHAASLDTLAVTMPERYQRQGKGGWQCPPGEMSARDSALVLSSLSRHPSRSAMPPSALDCRHSLLSASCTAFLFPVHWRYG